MEIEYAGTKITLTKLPNGKYMKPNIAQFTTAGRGCTWLDDVRVPTAENLNGGAYAGDERASQDGNIMKIRGEVGEYAQPSGRFPANLLVSDDVLNDGTITKSTGVINRFKSGAKPFGGAMGEKYESIHGVPDSGSYSRYFSLDAWAQNLPFLQVPKASKREKNEGLEGMEVKMKRNSLTTHNGQGDFRGVDKKPLSKQQNVHPTVKPLTLMSYLITLGSRPGEVVLDPFLGSGTTAIAAKQLGRKYIGIEREAEYVEIAQARLNAVPDTLL